MTAPSHPTQDAASRWTAQTVSMSGDILDRMERAVAKVRERLLRATAPLLLLSIVAMTLPSRAPGPVEPSSGEPAHAESAPDATLSPLPAARA